MSVLNLVSGGSILCDVTSFSLSTSFGRNWSLEMSMTQGRDSHSQSSLLSSENSCKFARIIIELLNRARPFRLNP